MSPIDRELLKIIRKIRDRIHTAAILRLMVLGIAAALALGLCIAAVSFFLPVYGVYRITLGLAGVLAAVVFLGASFFPPGNTEAALRADKMGLQERAVTALELIGQNGVFAELEKSDALLRLRALNYKKEIPIMPAKQYLLICLVFTALLALSGFIPNEMAEKAKALHQHKEQLVQEQKKVTKVAEQVKDNPKLTEEQKKQIQEKLSELKKELAQAKDAKDIEKALDRAEKKLRYIEKNYSGNDLQKIADVLAKNEHTREMAELIKKNDEKAIREHLKQLSNKLKNMTAKEQQQLSEELAKLAQELKSDPALRQAMSELSQKLANGVLGDISKELSQLEQSIGDLMQNENLREAIDEISKELQKGSAKGAAGQSGQDGFQGQGAQPSLGNKPGAGNQPGQGKGPGGGAGSGTDPGSENPQPVEPGASGIGKKDGSQAKTGEYEKIFTPKTLGGEGDTEKLPGQKGAGGTTEQVQTEKGPVVRGSSVPYDQVIGQYRQEAMESIETSDIPPGMKDLVKEYFTSLE